MAKSRYCQELQETICNAIAVYGLDEAGWTAGGIGRPTFYKWQHQHPDFRDAILAAKAEYRESSRDNVKRLANKAFVDYLNGSMMKVVHSKTETINPVTGEIVELEDWKSSPVGIPRWAIERALGDNLTELECLSRLAELNMLPSWVVDCAVKILDRAHQEIAQLLKSELPEPLAYELAREREHSGGISEDTFDRIRREVMGIDSVDRHRIAGAYASDG